MHTPKFPDRNSIFFDSDKTVTIVPTEKRIRAFFGSDAVADSMDASILRKSRSIVEYAIPERDVDMGSFEAVESHSDDIGEFRLYDYRKGEDKRKNAAREYLDPVLYSGKLKDMVIIDWNSADKWMEEEDAVEVHPRDPYTRIDIRESHRKVEFWMNGEKAASSESPMILFETGLKARYYIPPDDVRMDFLEPSAHKTGCPYKGTATYWDLRVKDQVYSNMVWSYLEPNGEAARIKGYMCFYSEKMDKVTVDGKEMH